MNNDTNGGSRKRERSNRYPGRSLAESIELARFLEDKGVDGLPASEIATALGYSNVKTNAFSARLSAARQFGLVTIKDDGYALTPLARSILHPEKPEELASLYRKALVEPPLYEELVGRLADKKVPTAPILANILYHHHQIIASAKLQAAETFLESSRFAGALGDDGVFRPNGSLAENSTTATHEPSPAPMKKRVATSDVRGTDIRIDLRLRGPDEGKAIRMRIPEAIASESLDRLIQAIKLHVKIDE